MDGKGTRVEEISDDNESDDAMAVEANDGISKEAGEENKTKQIRRFNKCLLIFQPREQQLASNNRGWGRGNR